MTVGTARSNGRNRKKRPKAGLAGRKPRKSRGGCTCRTFRKFCDVLCAARLSRLLSIFFWRASVLNARPTFDPARIAVTSIPLRSSSARKRLRNESRRKIYETIATSLWPAHLSNAKPATRRQNLAAPALQARPVPPDARSAGQICRSRSEAIFRPRITQITRIAPFA